MSTDDEIRGDGKRVEAPKLGEIVHYVVHSDNDELDVCRGYEVAMIVTALQTNDKYPDRWEIAGTCFGPSSYFKVIALDDFENELPGTWHRDRDCLESEVAKIAFLAGPGAAS